MAQVWISRPFQPTGRARVGGMAPALANLLKLWLRRRRNRRALATLTAEQMRDTGLDPEWVRRESGKPFWRR
jgi:uncharacterized protein YjiS (DUF1127 family)